MKIEGPGQEKILLFTEKKHFSEKNACACWCSVCVEESSVVILPPATWSHLNLRISPSPAILPHPPISLRWSWEGGADVEILLDCRSNFLPPAAAALLWPAELA